MKKVIKKNLIAVAIICMTLLMSTMSVYADAYSDWRYFGSINGITYKGQSFVYASSTSASGSGISWGSAWTESSTPVGAGRLGAAARLYKSNGALVKSSAVSYSGGSCSVHRATTSIYYGSGNFYAKGTSYVYNGNGYNSYTLYSSPIQTASLGELPVNENGETYGSEYFCNMQGFKPDLILAIGVNGNEGYVKSEDINKEAMTLAEGISFDSSGYIVPVYAVDGETIIDTFEVELSENL